MKSNQKNLSNETFSYNKLAALLTIVFFISTSYVAFVHHDSWIVDQDGIMYLIQGKEILEGNGKNVKFLDAPIGGAVFFASVDTFFEDGFFTMKMISLVSGGISVFIAYYILQNIVKPKTAFLGQVFFAFHPFVSFFAIQAEVDMFPLMFSMVSLYFITKKDLKLYDIVLFSIFIGISFMARTQAIVILIAVLLFFVISLKNNFNKNLQSIGLILFVFVITISPLLFYNFSTHGVILDHDAAFFYQQNSLYSTPEWKDEVKNVAMAGDGTLKAIFIDLDLFFKNYTHNLFYNSPSKFFNFFDKINVSPIPVIPLMGMIPIIGGYVFVIKQFKKQYNRNVQILLLIPPIFCAITSIVRLPAGEQFLTAWVSIAMISAIFFVDFVHDRFFSKQGRKIMLLFVVIGLILLSNLGYTFVLFRATSSADQPFTSIMNEINYFLNPELNIKKQNIVEGIWNELSLDPDIKNNYIMTPQFYFVQSEAKFLLVKFNEGPSDDTLENYITRENWNEWELFHSNIHSFPSDRLDQNHPIPKYIIHVDRPLEGKQHDFINILRDPNDVNIPSNFENIFYSPDYGIAVYRINHAE